ncbi:MAG: polyisoprenoid-binding protein [Gammaproteobacteria bacterium]|nr:YceI family protein [Gammaproteobacteria bacterium]NNC97804.1 polyisoprenoid-binding protein [Gammaproteobacteria bacterium]NNM13731.1 polyisoprenoid-binding protein [Gammaproteobacteria bacterium]
MRFVRVNLILACVVLSGCLSFITPTVKTELSELRAGQYQLDKSHTSVVFKIGHMGLSTYVGRFNDFDASLDFDPENIQALQLDTLVYPASVDVNNAKLQNTLQESDWFATHEYPEIRFVTTEVKQGSGNQLLISGELTLRGISKSIELRSKFNGGAVNMLTAKYTLGFEASTTIKRSDFGMHEFIPLVADEVEIEIHAEFQKR